MWRWDCGWGLCNGCAGFGRLVGQGIGRVEKVEEAGAEVGEGGRGSVFCESVWCDVVGALMLDCDLVFIAKPSDIVVLDKYVA